MKLYLRIIMAVFILGSLVLMSACEDTSRKDAEKFRETADTYLEKLMEEAPEQDTLSIDPDNEVSGLGNDFLVYTAWSMNYQDNFYVYVNKTDGSCMDTYYQLYLWDEADAKYKEISEEYGLPAYKELVLPRIAGSRVSGAKVKSMSEFWQIQEGSECVCVAYPKLSEEELMTVLKALKEENMFDEISEEGMEEKYYVLGDGVYIEERSGKDGGKMIERRKINIGE